MIKLPSSVFFSFDLRGKVKMENKKNILRCILFYFVVFFYLLYIWCISIVLFLSFFFIYFFCVCYLLSIHSLFHISKYTAFIHSFIHTFMHSYIHTFTYLIIHIPFFLFISTSHSSVSLQFLFPNEIFFF